MEKMKCLICLIAFTLSGFQLNAQGKNQVDAQGRKQGVWEKTYPKSLAYEYKGQFKDDKPVGTFTYFYPSTKLKAVIKHNEKTGRSETYMYHESGVLMAYGIYRNQKKDSVWTQYGPGGKLSSRETYKNGILEGKFTIYYIPEDPDGKMQNIAKTGNYKNGKLNGEIIEYFDYGTVKTKFMYLDGTKHGLCVSNHSNGQTMMHERFKYGIKHGYFQAFDESGKEIGRKYYRNGSLLEGEVLDKWLQECKTKGVNPNG